MWCFATDFILQTLSTQCSSIFEHHNLLSFLCFYLSHVEFKFFPFKYVTISSSTLTRAARDTSWNIQQKVSSWSVKWYSTEEFETLPKIKLNKEHIHLCWKPCDHNRNLQMVYEHTQFVHKYGGIYNTLQTSTVTVGLDHAKINHYRWRIKFTKNPVAYWLP